jgi:hypothetical protein
MHAMGWVLKIPQGLRDVCEIVIMFKVLYHFKLFYRKFFDNEYKMSRLSILGLEEAERKGERSFPPVDVRGRVGLVGERQPLDKKKRVICVF